MITQTRGVDVLAVMRDAADREESRAGDLDGINSALCRMYAERMEDAADAIAALIEVGRKVEQADHDGTLTDELMGRFRAALARTGGTK